MPRRIFTERDLSPLRAVTRQVLEREPDAAVVAAAAAPIKRRIPRPGFEQRTDVRLPVELERSANPDGVPLHEVAQELRKDVPGLEGVSATPGGLSLKFSKPPTAAQMRKIDALLSDRARLESLKPAVPVRGPVEPAALAGDDVLRALRDPQTTDAAWLRAFRAYALEHLIEGGE
jgi:hypothetical protein